MQYTHLSKFNVSPTRKKEKEREIVRKEVANIFDKCLQKYQNLTYKNFIPPTIVYLRNRKVQQ